MAVIKDVAAQAGVSVGSVSKYLNRPDALKADTRERIESAIRLLDYRPSPLARSMRTGKTGVVAVAVPEIVNPFFAETYNAIHKVAAQHGLSTTLHTTDSSLNRLKDCLSERSIRQVDGAIFCFVDEDESVSAYLAKIAQTIPIVLLSQNLADSPFDSVAIDVFEGVRLSTCHLAESGRRRIAYVGGPEDSRISREKHLGYLRALEQKQLVADRQLFARGDFSLKTGFVAARQFSMTPLPPDAIVAENDLLAIGCMKFLLQNGIRIPQQVAVCGFDDISLAAMYEPALTTVAIPIERMASEALDMLDRAIHKRRSKHSQSILPTELIVRASTDPTAPIHLG